MSHLRTILSLFDGMSTARTALENIGVTFERYYASEIEKNAIRFSSEKYPDTTHLGDVRNWLDWEIDWSKVDLICSGSPCQDVSRANVKRTGLSGSRSSLFWVFVDILNHTRKHNPNVLFLQENVFSMYDADAGVISQALCVWPQMIDSRLLTAQSRRRWYWQNAVTVDTLFDKVSAIPKPKDKGVRFSDIIESGYVNREKSPALLSGYMDKIPANRASIIRWLEAAGTGFNRRTFAPIVWMDDECRVSPRRLIKTEMCRLQGFPDDWMSAEWISPNMACRMLGNGWTLPVIEHIFFHMLKTWNYE